MGRDIKRWAVEPDDNWLIQIESSENKLHPWSGLDALEAEEAFTRSYPAIAKHLFKYKEELKKRTDHGRYYWELRSCDYWDAFDKPKLFAPEIQNSVQYAPDVLGYRCINKACIIVHDHWQYLSGILNSPTSWWFSQQIFTSKQGGFFEFTRQFLFQIPIPKAEPSQRSQIEVIVKTLLSGRLDNRLEQLLNGFVYELFFKEDLHARNLTLFAEAEKAGLGALSGLEGPALLHAAAEFADRVFSPTHPLYAMLFDLQALDVVRIIEGSE
jgi:hypothetical protein